MNAFAARFGEASVRWAMVCLLVAVLPAVALFRQAGRRVLVDLQRADGRDAG